MNSVLAKALAQLARDRPIFHSEADFQFALAWQCKIVDPNLGVRLELPIRAVQKSYKLDLLLLAEGRRIGVELKYLKAGLEHDWEGESYRLKNVGAHDLGRYDVLKDIVRLEAMLAADRLDEGYAITLTNDPKYWLPRLPGRRVDEAFGLEEGRVLKGELRWADHAGGTIKGREDGLAFTNRYALRWQDYSQVAPTSNGALRMLCVKVERTAKLVG